MLKVLMLAPDPRWGGGVVSFVEILSSHLFPVAKATVLHIGQRKNWWGRVLRPLMLLIDDCRLTMKLWSGHYDICHINLSYVPFSIVRDGIFLALLQCFKTIKVLVFIHGWDAVTQNKIEESPLLQKLVFLTFRRADHIFLHTSRFKNHLVTLGLDPHRIEIITTMFEGALLGGSKHEVGRSSKTILFLSRFLREKGIFELVDAFQKISKKYSDVSLALAGDGPDVKALKDYVEMRNLEEKVSFPGYLIGTDKAEILLNSHIWILPSYYPEGCPLSLMEAMGAGLPIITTAVGGIGDFFVDGKNGLLLKSVDPTAIAIALETLLVDEHLRREIVAYNRREAWEKYEAKIVCRKITKVYQDLAESR